MQSAVIIAAGPAEDKRILLTFTVPESRRLMSVSVPWLAQDSAWRKTERLRHCSDGFASPCSSVCYFTAATQAVCLYDARDPLSSRLRPRCSWRRCQRYERGAAFFRHVMHQMGTNTFDALILGVLQRQLKLDSVGDQ
jgi:hypothetical protein